MVSSDGFWFPASGLLDSKVQKVLIERNLGNGGTMKTTEMSLKTCMAMLKGLADENRYSMVQLLLKESLSVSALSKELGIAQPSVSKHLAVLRGCGIVVTERVGKEVRGAIAPEFRAEVKRRKGTIDFGCCEFRFNWS